MLQASFQRNDKLAYTLIGVVSVVVFAVVASLSRFTLDVDLGFDPHIFATINAIINTAVSMLLVAGLMAVRQKQYVLHRNLMLGAILLSVLFLVSYILHHLFGTETKFGGAGTIRYVYFIILITHIILAGIILPFILYTAYQSLTGDFKAHKKIARYTFPLWLYVSVTGVVVYLMISPYYMK